MDLGQYQKPIIRPLGPTKLFRFLFGLTFIHFYDVFLTNNRLWGCLHCSVPDDKPDLVPPVLDGVGRVVAGRVVRVGDDVEPGGGGQLQELHGLGDVVGVLGEAGEGDANDL